MVRRINQNLKNIYGWRSKRKIIVFSVDDYGNVRLDSKKARENMDREGLKVYSRFDAYDTLENREDLEILFETLSSVKDAYGKNAVFTPFAVPCNIDFEKMASENYEQYHYELLPQTYEKKSANDPQAYSGTWELWNDGITGGLMSPEFHGREHLNLKVLKEKLKERNAEVLVALKNRSYTSLSGSGFPTIIYTAAFDFSDITENYEFEPIIKDGLNSFEKIFGKHSIHFTPPGGRENQIIHEFLNDNGVIFIDTPLIKKEHAGSGRYKTFINYTGKKNKYNMVYVVRNVVFEPTSNRGIDWVEYTLKQIDAAFRWHRIAFISSHRVNFCGHICKENRSLGINALKVLLNKICKKWPDVEFMSSRDALEYLKNSNN